MDLSRSHKPERKGFESPLPQPKRGTLKPGVMTSVQANSPSSLVQSRTSLPGLRSEFVSVAQLD